MNRNIFFKEISFKTVEEFEKYKAWLFEKVNSKEIIKVDLKPISIQTKDFFRLPDENTVWALVAPFDPDFTGYCGGFIEAEEVLEWKPPILRKAVFEEINFSDEDEYLRFVKWLDEKVDEKKIVELQRKSNNPLEKRFFQVSGESPTWALSIPSELNKKNRWGYFTCLPDERL